MKAPELPENEADRQASLESLNLLETAIEERFERVTRLALRLIGVPISAVSLIDGRRQWFKSIQGLNQIETNREVSFCGHAILGDDLFVVEDTTKDDRFHDNPLVTGRPGIRFYAGHPVRSPDGQKIGTLCVIDTAPRVLTENQIEDLRDLAAMVEIEFKSNQLVLPARSLWTDKGVEK